MCTRNNEHTKQKNILLLKVWAQEVLKCETQVGVTKKTFASPSEKFRRTICSSYTLWCTVKFTMLYMLLKHSQVLSEHFLSVKDHDLKHASHWDHLELRHWTLRSPNIGLEFTHSHRIQITAQTGTVRITHKKKIFEMISLRYYIKNWKKLSKNKYRLCRYSKRRFGTSSERVICLYKKQQHKH